MLFFNVMMFGLAPFSPSWAWDIMPLLVLLASSSISSTSSSVRLWRIHQWSRNAIMHVHSTPQLGVRPQQPVLILSLAPPSTQSQLPKSGWTIHLVPIKLVSQMIVRLPGLGVRLSMSGSNENGTQRVLDSPAVPITTLASRRLEAAI
ncbi:unknown protein [Seminavis robusta]|uniref:Secreted protein n=1 Tax=Seminavis robusta TaxID=568900 RepID=A0A9N8HRT8_9STRA|nr:unknown protein [Seminavis robusta]|eukprot:Sro1103_g241691.1  (148) ;mRNA; f:13945-14388